VVWARLNYPLSPGRWQSGQGDRDFEAQLEQQTWLIVEHALVAALADSQEQQEERELLVRVQAGDRGAFELLVRRNLPRARLLARRLMQDPDDADDLVQDAFLRALERIGTFDVSRSFQPWFTRLLVNLSRDLHRKHNVRRTEAHDPDRVPGGSRPDRQTERSELRSSLEQALEALPERQRLILTLFEIDGRSSDEIAGMLNVKPVTVRWHLHQAKQTLRAALKEWME
jgi:RNA polymerase sigma-70 factor, ECF subfamily